MNYFFSTGEASGELAAVELALAIRRFDPQARCEGIGAERMREAGFALWCDTTGWASLGPFQAIQRLPKLLVAGMQTARHIAEKKPDLVILIDFGAFHVRLATLLRKRFRFRGPILDWFPPGAWLNSERTARKVSSVATPLPAFTQQYEFYRNLGLQANYFGHPLVSRYTLRAPRPVPPADGGKIALLPGSRPNEIRRHLPVLERAVALLRRRRPKLEAITGVNGLQDAIADADAAFVASGTAVLETTLSGVPAIALYILDPLLAMYARKVYSGKYITIPNLIMNEMVVPEILQERATPENLAAAMDELLHNPQHQYRRFTELQKKLGPSGAIDRTAQFAVSLAQRATDVIPSEVEEQR